MNRRLQIDIRSIQNEHEEEEGGEDEYERDEEDESQEESKQQSQDGSEEDYEDKDRGGISPEQVSKSGQAFDSVETFGNNRDPYSHHQDFISQLMHRPDTFRTNKLNNLTNHNLSETPISRHTPNSYSNRRQEIQQSNIDDEIARIISKVNQSSKQRASNPKGQWMEVEKVKKIHRINDQLLKENTQLINQISELQKKMNQLHNKLSSKKKVEDSTLTKTLKKYRDKLDNAMNLNSKLSVRLTSQRSRSNAISNTFRSMLNKEVSSASMVSNSLKSPLIKGNSGFGKNKRKKSNLTEHVYCEKCCKEIQPIQKTILSKEFNSKELIFSPVLQVKNYEIMAAKPTNQFQLHRKPAQRQVEVQVSFEEGVDEMEVLRKEEEELQRVIEKNNEQLAEYEEQLYRLVEIG